MLSALFRGDCDRHFERYRKTTSFADLAGPRKFTDRKLCNYVSSALKLSLGPGTVAPRERDRFPCVTVDSKSQAGPELEAQG